MNEKRILLYFIVFAIMIPLHATKGDRIEKVKKNQAIMNQRNSLIAAINKFQKDELKPLANEYYRREFDWPCKNQFMLTQATLNLDKTYSFFTEELKKHSTNKIALKETASQINSTCLSCLNLEKSVLTFCIASNFIKSKSFQNIQACCKEILDKK